MIPFGIVLNLWSNLGDRRVGNLISVHDPFQHSSLWISNRVTCLGIKLGARRMGKLEPRKREKAERRIRPQTATVLKEGFLRGAE